MPFAEREIKCGLKKLFCYLMEGHNVSKTYKLVYSDKIIFAKYDTDYETDNCLEEDEPGYDEYYGIAFLNLETGNLFEVMYANMPDAIYDGDIRVI